MSDETPAPKKSSSSPPKSAAVRLGKPPAKSSAKLSAIAAGSAGDEAAEKAASTNPAKLQADARSREKALCAAQAAIDKKGLGPVLLDLREQKSYTDYLLVVSGPGPRATKAVAESVQETMAEHGYRAIGVEGVREGRWALLDYGDLVVHVFDHPLREFYDLEGMWFDAPKVELQVPPEQRIIPGAMSYADEGAYGLSE